MLRKLTRQFIFSRLVFCLVPLAIMPTQHDAKSGKRPELITVQMKVMDIKTGSTIDNADVLIKWSEGPEPHSATATTNSSGVARLTDVPRGKVEIRVIAKGYKVHYSEFNGNHGYVAWRSNFAEMLQALIGTPTSPSAPPPP